MFWKRKKDREPCNHYWHKLSEEREMYYDGYDCEFRDVTYVFCEKCESESRISPERWERINKKQEILTYKYQY